MDKKFLPPDHDPSEKYKRGERKRLYPMIILNSKNNIVVGTSLKSFPPKSVIVLP